MTSTIRKGDFYTLSATTTFIYLCIYFIYSIGNARFMKTILGRHERDGYVVVKIFVKPELGMSLKKRVKKLKGSNDM